MLSFRVNEWYQPMTHLTQYESEALTALPTSFSVLKNPIAVPRFLGSEPWTHCH